MNEISKKPIHKNSKLRTLHACLIALEADPKKVYSYGYNKFGREQGTLYGRYPYGELHAWLDELHKKSLRYHPDLHQENKDFYENKMAEMNSAYQRGKHLLSYRRH